MIEEKRQDETILGGFYIVGGKVVNANGEPIAGWSVVNGEAVKDEPTKDNRAKRG